jgi:hypothetical protein
MMMQFVKTKESIRFGRISLLLSGLQILGNSPFTSHVSAMGLILLICSRVQLFAEPIKQTSLSFSNSTAIFLMTDPMPSESLIVSGVNHSVPTLGIFKIQDTELKFNDHENHSHVLPHWRLPKYLCPGQTIFVNAKFRIKLKGSIPSASDEHICVFTDPLALSHVMEISFRVTKPASIQFYTNYSETPTYECSSNTVNSTMKCQRTFDRPFFVRVDGLPEMFHLDYSVVRKVTPNDKCVFTKIPELEDFNDNLPDVTIKCISLNQQKIVLGCGFMAFLVAMGIMVAFCHTVPYRNGGDHDEARLEQASGVTWSRSLAGKESCEESVAIEFGFEEPCNFSSDNSDLSEPLIETLSPV